MSLPHRFPFRLVERGPTGVVYAVTTASMWALHGRDELPFPIALEMLAQGALELLQRPGEGAAGQGGGLLAGLDDAELLAPVHAGDRLEIEVELVGRFGPLVKAIARMVGEDGVRVKATLLVAATAT